jgi:hypothetical protein
MRNILLFLVFVNLVSHATDYHIGPGQALTSISQAPWDNLQAGDNIYIHWQAQAYFEKWVINAQGTAQNPISVIGVSNSSGDKPVIDGNGAVTVAGVNFWNESRGVIKVGGSNTPSDGLPQYIVIENLDIRSGRPPFQFTDDGGNVQSYVNNAASIYVEKAANLTIRNCTLHDSGNGLFIGAFNGDTQNILIEKNYIYDNGNVARIFEHNTYTAGINVTYQYNRFGPLRSGAGGNNLKDRSAGLKVRYNWIESGNRQLDLVDAEDSIVLVNHPSYSTTFVYGNVLIEPDGAGNSQIIHYGGDSGTTSEYRKGTLYLYNNTIISTRSGNTTLVNLSTNDESAQVFNNILYNTANGSNFAMIDNNGILNLFNNWIPTNWRDCHCTPLGTVSDMGNNIEGNDPQFTDFLSQDFSLQSNSTVINNGVTLLPTLLPENNLLQQYIKHQSFENRPNESSLDMGAFEYCGINGCNIVFVNGFE